MRMLAALVLALALTVATTARADDGMRCGDVLVFVGDHEADVTRKCGAPTQTETHTIVHRRRPSVVVDTWTYDRGHNRFVYTLTFRDGVLAEIASGEYGSR